MDEGYYLIEDGEKKGPYTVYELKQLELDIHTEIITPTSDKPQYASELPELDAYFEAQGILYPTEDNLATFGKRVGAFLMDYLGIYILVSNILTRTGWVVLPADYKFGAPLPSAMFIQSATTLATFWVYNTICEATSLKGSLGKKALKLIVVDINGKGPSLLTALIRNFGVILSTTIWLPFLSVLFSRYRQAWYDSLAKTYVIQVNERLK